MERKKPAAAGAVMKSASRGASAKTARRLKGDAGHLNEDYGFPRAEKGMADRREMPGRPLVCVVVDRYCPNLFRYSSEVMNALTISALM